MAGWLVKRERSKKENRFSSQRISPSASHDVLQQEEASEGRRLQGDIPSLPVSRSSTLLAPPSNSPGAEQKQKLRVGKSSTAKSGNHTSTTFRTKAIVVAAQNVHHAADSTKQFQHHLSLLSHHSAATRRDSLAYLSSQRCAPSLLPRLAPLMQDGSASVRGALLALLDSAAVPARRPHRLLLPPSLLLHVWSALSHIEPGVRADATAFLAWAMRVAPAETLAHGGWEKVLALFPGVIGGGGGGVVVAKTVLRHLAVLRDFLETACPPPHATAAAAPIPSVGALHWSAAIHLRRAAAAEYRHYGLLDARDDADAGPVDADGRRRWCREKGADVVSRLRETLAALTKEGGEVGRAAGRVVVVLDRILEVEEV